MAWDEWEQIKAGVAARHQGEMQLNSAGAGTGDSAMLRTNSPGKKEAIRSLRDDIRPGANTAGGHADDSTNAAEREFKGWDTGSGLKDAHEKWARQLTNLKSRLGKDQEALRKTKQDFQQVDVGIHNDLAQLDTSTPDPRRNV
uniref:Amino acid ABC transporter permease n=1 Tax=Streptomyces sp. NBC_01401 TaxID=2903854 RepID=A0AAU3GW45_9ACTN